jgi:hypothetical protein
MEVADRAMCTLIGLMLSGDRVIERHSGILNSIQPNINSHTISIFNEQFVLVRILWKQWN